MSAAGSLDRVASGVAAPGWWSGRGTPPGVADEARGSPAVARSARAVAATAVHASGCAAIAGSVSSTASTASDSATDPAAGSASGPGAAGDGGTVATPRAAAGPEAGDPADAASRAAGRRRAYAMISERCRSRAASRPARAASAAPSGAVARGSGSRVPPAASQRRRVKPASASGPTYSTKRPSCPARAAATTRATSAPGRSSTAAATVDETASASVAAAGHKPSSCQAHSRSRSPASTETIRSAWAWDRLANRTTSPPGIMVPRTAWPMAWAHPETRSASAQSHRTR